MRKLREALLVCGVLFPVVPAAVPISPIFVQVDPAGTWIFTDAEIPPELGAPDIPAPPTSFSLATLFNDPDYPLRAGDFIVLEQVGTYRAGVDPEHLDDGMSMMAIFVDSSGQTVPPGSGSRVEDAVTPPSLARNIPTDEPGDFLVTNGGFINFVQIPIGAVALLFGPIDSFYGDNSDPDGDYGVNIASFKHVISEAVQPQPQGSGMTAELRPNLGLSLDDALLLGGFDHFNWLQRVVAAPFLSLLPAGALPQDIRTQDGSLAIPPFFDPPAGGFQYMIDACNAMGIPVSGFPIRDSKPWYWDEQFGGGVGACRNVGFASSELTSDKTFPTHLEFEDYPGVGVDDEVLRALILASGLGVISFETFLVGVTPQGPGVVFDRIFGSNFRWIYSAGLTGLSDRSFVVFSNSDPSLGAPGTTEVTEILEPDDFTPELRDAIIEGGACLSSNPCLVFTDGFED